jgi:hypothetical protein
LKNGGKQRQSTSRRSTALLVIFQIDCYGDRNRQNNVFFVTAATVSNKVKIPLFFKIEMSFLFQERLGGVFFTIYQTKAIRAVKAPIG